MFPSKNISDMRNYKVSAYELGGLYGCDCG
jgi:hypothetical protein